MENLKTRTEVSSAEKTARISPPVPWRVVFHNDDVTSVGFVIRLLKRIFLYEEEEAYLTTRRIEAEGKAVVGRYPRSIAETKAFECAEAARNVGYPLVVIAERDE